MVNSKCSSPAGFDPITQHKRPLEVVLLSFDWAADVVVVAAAAAVVVVVVAKLLLAAKWKRNLHISRPQINQIGLVVSLPINWCIYLACRGSSSGLWSDANGENHSWW